MFGCDGISAGSRRRFGVPSAISFVVHVLVVAAVPAISALHPVAVAPPESVFVVLNPRRPAPAAAAAQRSSPAAKPPKPRRKVQPPAILVQPVAIPDPPALVDPAPEPAPAPASAPAEELARSDGLPGALGSGGASTAAVAILATNAEGHVEYDDTLMTPPERISGPDPEYTYLARAHEVQGLMVVKCILTVLGAVRDCRVVEGLPYMEGAVLDALLRRRYTPARLTDGRAVEVEYTFRIRLQLVGPVKLP